MKPTIKLASITTPDGSEMALFQHDHDFHITVGPHDLMHSRQHESELDLARLGCRHLANADAPCALIGGLGMGYTLRQTLDMLSPRAKVVVAELLPGVVEWNREFLGELAGHPLKDPRVEIVLGDVMALIARSSSAFDAIMLDVDNGPRCISAAGNERLYRLEGISACRRALTPTGCLSIWSAEPERDYERALVNAGLHVRRYSAPAYKGGKARACFVWVAAEDQRLLPPGGGGTLDPIVHGEPTSVPAPGSRTAASPAMKNTPSARSRAHRPRRSGDYLVWMDCEMTGLDPERHALLEIATVITNSALEIVAEGPVLAIRQGERALGRMDAWCRRTHARSGLLERVRTRGVTVREAEVQTLRFLRRYCTIRSAPLCGNSIGQDRRFLVKYMPALHAFFHYQSIDVSTVKQLVRRWYGSRFDPPKKQERHLALADIKESIRELAHYRRTVFVREGLNP